MTTKILLRRGDFTQVQPGRLSLGEIVYCIPSKQLLVGDPDCKEGYNVVSEVVVGPDDALYSKTKDNRLIPLCIKNY